VVVVSDLPTSQILDCCGDGRGPDWLACERCRSGRAARLSAETIPPYIYLPCSPVSPGDGEVSIDLRRIADGRIALLIYSALDRFVDCCGDQQPWTAIPATDLDRIQQLTGFELIFMDVRIPEQLRRNGDE
jgi:hypothetical protein